MLYIKKYCIKAADFSMMNFTDRIGKLQLSSVYTFKCVNVVHKIKNTLIACHSYCESKCNEAITGWCCSYMKTSADRSEGLYCIEVWECN